MNRLILILICVFSSVLIAMAEETRTTIADSNIRTLRAYVEDNELSEPIITLNSGQHITVSFDIVSDDVEYLQYSLVHCNADWQPSQLTENEYLNGFNVADITDHEFSVNTFTHFVHYSISLPNEDMNMTVSGNYLLRIYPENCPDDVIAQVRFMVNESAVWVKSDVTSRTDIDYNGEHQQLGITIKYNNYSINNAYSDLKVFVNQNGRVDNEVLLASPLSATSSQIVYEHKNDLIFPAGNEYRRFEATTTRYPGMGVESVKYYDPMYHVTLQPDKLRADKNYVYDRTQHGRYVVRELDASDSGVGADYMVVHFSLESDYIPGGEIYIEGAFTNHEFSDAYRMLYNRSTERYEADVIMKQGAYNYQYLWVPNGKTKGETKKIEGDKYQTVNEYLVRVYHRPVGERYDHLIGVGTTYSGN